MHSDMFLLLLFTVFKTWGKKAILSIMVIYTMEFYASIEKNGR